MTQPAGAGTATHGFLFADLRDYSAYVESQGDQAAADLLTRYRSLVRSVVERFAGSEIRTEGDSFYVVLPTASRAVSCGMAILEAAAADPILRVGVGVHAGETAETGEGPVGSAVNIAARVCALAPAGELWVTDTVRTLTRTLVTFRFVPRGTPSLKGISEPIALYRVAEPDDPEVMAMSASPAQGITPQPIPGRGAPHRRRLLLAGGASVALLLVVGVGGFIVLSSGGAAAPSSPPASTGLSASATVSPSPTSGLSAAETALVARLPLRVRDACLPSTSAQTAVGATASVTCPLPADGGAASVTYNAYDQPALLATTFDRFVADQGDPKGTCGASPRGVSAWQVGPTFSGHVLCYTDPGGHPHLAWTYESGDGALTLGTAERTDGDWQRLAAWWDEYRVLMTH